MSQTSEVDDMVGALLRGNYLSGGDPCEDECNRIAKEIVAGMKSDDPKVKVNAMRKRDVLRTAVIRMYHGGDNPKQMPLELVKHARAHPANNGKSAGFHKKEQRESIDGPTRAIRVFCIECQGGDTTGVRECATVTCQLYAFRMGSSPFFGRLVGADDELTDADIAAEEAEETDGNPV